MLPIYVRRQYATARRFCIQLDWWLCRPDTAAQWRHFVSKTNFYRSGEWQEGARLHLGRNPKVTAELYLSPLPRSNDSVPAVFCDSMLACLHRKRTRSSGFRARLSTKGGRKVLKARRKRGRKMLCPAHEYKKWSFLPGRNALPS